VCAAAGNEGPQQRTIGSPGIEPSIITVGATDDKGTVNPGDDTIAHFSSRGPTIDQLVKPDLVAPGTDIISLRSPNAYVDKKVMRQNRVDQWYFNMSGTSMATPIVVGLVAQILQANPSYSPNQVKQALLGMAQDMGLDKNHQGQGYVYLGTK
ncbi:MAG: S8 family serine peptidase, partial [Bacillota bacterium]|nr:S8 family serine peptidase [Bacillota bacterium]